jgi:hypothetical protein
LWKIGSFKLHCGKLLHSNFIVENWFIQTLLWKIGSFKLHGKIDSNYCGKLVHSNFIVEN